MNLDALIFAAHPDDAELTMAGTIAKLSCSNYKVGIVDFTRGELGTRGTAETREKEACQAAVILKLAIRENLLIPDGSIQRNKENLMKVVTAIRRYKPKIIFAPYFNDRHPDHIDASKLVKEAMFVSGLAKVQTFDKEVAQEAYRPKKLFYFMQTYGFEPTFIVDVSDYFELKMKAVRAFESQFYDPNSKEPETFISQPEFLSFIEARAKVYGFRIGKKFGEPFYCEENIELDLSNLLK
ncbi:MAG TPA: bacillithiol biosynthesis deacetylase BshB1 [Ignavibacteriaceae bacterium]|nr:bacillithiol biosynthesis deacetylase BshB1 [Ignavibacteriaceae bacterium]